MLCWMRLLSRCVVVLAQPFVEREWCALKQHIDMACGLYIDDHKNRPSVLAEELLVCGEDHRFFRHGGIDTIAVCRAVWRGLVLLRPEGASTIEMQIVRVMSGRFERTLS